MAWPSEVSYTTDASGNVIGLVGTNNSSIYLGNKDITTKRIKVGMNYIPGWSGGWDKPGGGGPWPTNPWKHVPQAGKPLKGEYDEGTQEIVDQQLCEMRDYGVDFVMVDWFFSTANAMSQTSNTIGTGTKTFVFWPNVDRGFQAGMEVRISAFVDDPYSYQSNYMQGTVTSYTVATGTLVMNILSSGGSGTYGVPGIDNGWAIQCTSTSTVGQHTPVGTLDHWIKLYKTSTVPNKPKLCLTWANATNAGYVTDTGYTNFIQVAIDNYFNDPNYLTVNGKPVLGVVDFGTNMPLLSTSYSTDKAFQQAGLMAVCKANAVTAGYSGIYLVAGMSAPTVYWISLARNVVFDAFYALNCAPRFYSGTDTLSPYIRRTYADIDNAYFGVTDANNLTSWTQSWKESNAILLDGKKIWVPLSAGFDSNAIYPLSSFSRLYGTPTREEFAQHLRKAVQFIKDNAAACDGFVVIQSWNEHLEGSVCEPNTSSGFEKLQIIKDTLSC